MFWSVQVWYKVRTVYVATNYQIIHVPGRAPGEIIVLGHEHKPSSILVGLVQITLVNKEHAMYIYLTFTDWPNKKEYV